MPDARRGGSSTRLGRRRQSAKVDGGAAYRARREEIIAAAGRVFLEKGYRATSFKDIAAKYRGSKDAASQLAKKVKAGGKGVWGEIPMPPNAHVKDADIQAIVRWILGLK